MRITTSVVLFYVWFSASAAVVDAAGVTEAWGVSSSIGVGDALSDSLDGLNTIESGGISAESLVGLYTVGTNAIETFLLGLVAGPRLLANTGMPMIFVAFLHAPIALLAGRMLLYALAQREL